MNKEVKREPSKRGKKPRNPVYYSTNFGMVERDLAELQSSLAHLSTLPGFEEKNKYWKYVYRTIMLDSCKSMLKRLNEMVPHLIREIEGIKEVLYVDEIEDVDE